MSDSWRWLTFPPWSEQYICFWICASLLVFFASVMIPLALGTVVAPYGRYEQIKVPGVSSGPSIPPRLGWIVQESPTLIFSAFLLLTADERVYTNPANIILVALFVIHYINRTIIFPFRIVGGKPIRLIVVVAAMCFCSFNTWLQIRFLTALHAYPSSYVFSPTFLLGVAIWLTGFYINIQADNILLALRKPGESGYKIPHGGMFEYVSGANYFGEIVEWTGFAVATGFAMPGVTFAVATACNIGPRALQHHQWYLSKFDNYPPQRKAIIPFVL
eukprot:c10107_g1_i2.p1 GENE.c10107_g1_i2~~c10107_g1_i2.p1  ORF type:complete len:274 (-),score=40.16 c10107_g1_i2:500-1321(-)